MTLPRRLMIAKKRLERFLLDRLLEPSAGLSLPSKTVTGETPPPEFAEAAAELENLGVELVWTWTYNAGSNPFALTVRAEHLERPEVRAPGGELEGAWTDRGFSTMAHRGVVPVHVGGDAAAA